MELYRQGPFVHIVKSKIIQMIIKYNLENKLFFSKNNVCSYQIEKRISEVRVLLHGLNSIKNYFWLAHIKLVLILMYFQMKPFLWSAGLDSQTYYRQPTLWSKVLCIEYVWFVAPFNCQGIYPYINYKCRVPNLATVRINLNILS